MRIWYLPLEPYVERYTELLEGWTTSRWRRRGLDVAVISGAPNEGRIVTGRVLDAHGRCTWALQQMTKLIELLPEVRDEDVIYVEDMFHPGWEALPYVLHQTGQRPRVFTRNYAQSVDVHDFTFAMRRWMRSYELMVDRTATAVLCASSIHADEMRVGGFEGRIEVVGLPFDAEDVRRRAGPERELVGVVVYASRLDPEKQPYFMLEVASLLRYQGVALKICTAAPSPRSSDPEALRAILAAEGQGDVIIARGTTKASYYSLLQAARGLLNTSLQEYVSFAVLEASALGCPAVVPCHKAFPEVFAQTPYRMYRPWDAREAARLLLDARSWDPEETAGPARYHDGTLDRIADLFMEKRR